MKAIFLLVFAGFLQACTPGAETEPAEIFYKRDVRITSGGKTFVGAAVLPEQALYDLRMQFAGSLDLFTFTDCHAQWTKEKAGSGGIFAPKNRLEFEYRPTFADGTYCPVEIGGYEAIKGRHSWGFLDFKTRREELPAKVECNGSRENRVGVSVCQSLKGLVQRISFDSMVDVNPPEGCGMPLNGAPVFEFPMNPGRCVYAFMEVMPPHRVHRLTTLGYDKILIRETGR